MTYARTNQFGGFERHKARCAIRGDQLRPGLDVDKARIASHITSQAGRRALLAAAAEGYAVASFYVPGSFMRGPNDPRFRFTMRQPPISDDMLASFEKICVLRRAILRDPASNAQ